MRGIKGNNQQLAIGQLCDARFVIALLAQRDPRAGDLRGEQLRITNVDEVFCLVIGENAFSESAWE